jgi:hypothetical protein
VLCCLLPSEQAERIIRRREREVQRAAQKQAGLDAIERGEERERVGEGKEKEGGGAVLNPRLLDEDQPQTATAMIQQRAEAAASRDEAHTIFDRRELEEIRQNTLKKGTGDPPSSLLPLSVLSPSSLSPYLCPACVCAWSLLCVCVCVCLFVVI